MWHADNAHRLKDVSVVTKNMGSIAAKHIPEIFGIDHPLTVLDSYPKVTKKQRRDLESKVGAIHAKYQNLWGKAAAKFVARSS